MRIMVLRFYRGNGDRRLYRGLDGERRGDLDWHGTMLLQYIALLPMGVE
jgi:hypothetical protein